jgi:hypothetical protein
MLPSTAVLIPMLGRPHTVAPLVRSLRENTPEPHRAVFICSPDDRAVHDAVRSEGLEPLVVTWPPGRADYQKKINLGYRKTTDPLIFTGACDVTFHYRWLTRAILKLGPGIGVVGTQDKGNPRVLAGQHATHSLVTREYADLGTIDGQPGILSEVYDHSFCDDELVGTAKHRKAWAFAHESIVEHNHPSWSKAPMDEVYLKGRAQFRRDALLSRRRRTLWT